MTIQRELGEKGEQLAVGYLKAKGFDILQTNWRYRRAEIDIIAMDDDVLVCIEVKARSYDYFGPPEISVGKKKEALLVEALQSYMELIDHQWEIRFDIVAILFENESKPRINHIQNAFFPGLST